ncbi:MAG: RNA methyltransferase [Bacteroidales bacterium]|nr:RNA methyltransferase [Bacteroidales bacterium]
MDKELLNYLEGFILEKRNELFNRILLNRTRYITVVLEDIYQSHNASAILRSCDCFGIQDVHIIENRNEYELSSQVTMGSDKWLNLIKYNQSENNTLHAINAMKKSGYRIVATTPHKEDSSLNNFDLSKGKVALLFGTELNGLSKEALELADEYLRIPMYGFTESFNISVSAAIILHSLSESLRKSDIKWNLMDAEKEKIKLDWLRKSIKGSELIEANYLKQGRKS